MNNNNRVYLQALYLARPFKYNTLLGKNTDLEKGIKLHLNKNIIQITLISLDDPELSDEYFSVLLDESVKTLRECVGKQHGPNALKVLGDRIFKYRCQIDRSTDGLIAVEVNFVAPSYMTELEMIDYVVKCWSQSPLGTSEYYVT